MTPAKPSLDLLRSLTDEHVLRALMDARRLTRAELATRTGISKPTASESVRRLTAAGLLRDTGDRTTGRGRVGSYYAIAGAVGTVLVVGIAPDGVVAEGVDCHGDVLARERVDLARLPSPAQVGRALSNAAGEVRRAVAGPVRLAVVSAADPVDRRTGRLIHLPDAPFLVGELSPVEVLRPLVDGPVLVDNDVNWAARAERATAGELDDFVYLHLGDGLGCAVVSDGDVRRGFTGAAGEIAHLITVGPRGRAMPFTEVFAELGLRRPGSTAIDSQALLTALNRQRTRTAVVAAIEGVLAAQVALCDPEVVVVGGEWGTPAVVDAVATRFREAARHVPVRAATVTGEPALTGARGQALHDLRAVIANLPRAA